MNIGDYVKQNKKFLIGGAVAIVGLVALSFAIPQPKPQAVHHHRTHKTVITGVVASPSASLTPIASTSGTMSNGVCHAKYLLASDPQAVLPDPNCTPGVTNPEVTQDTIQTTICTVGYTSNIRPPVSYTNNLKREGMTQYGFTDAIYLHEEDHFIPLELGGAPSDPKNLWPEPHASLNEKDTVENYLHQQVCLRNITLAQAQKEITTNWYNVFLSLPAGAK